VLFPAVIFSREGKCPHPPSQLMPFRGKKEKGVSMRKKRKKRMFKGKWVVKMLNYNICRQGEQRRCMRS
jgi:hypothetical protein